MRRWASSPFAYRKSGRRAALRQHDRIDVPAVVGLAAMRHAPVAVELLRIRVRARVDVLDRPDPGRGEPRDHVAGEIEQEIPLARARAEEARIGGGGRA